MQDYPAPLLVFIENKKMPNNFVLWSFATIRLKKIWDVFELWAALSVILPFVGLCLPIENPKQFRPSWPLYIFLQTLMGRQQLGASMPELVAHSFGNHMLEVLIPSLTSIFSSKNSLRKEFEASIMILLCTTKINQLSVFVLL
jgi:hypothetical protein